MYIPSTFFVMKDKHSVNDWLLFPEYTPHCGFVLVTRRGREGRVIDILWHQGGVFTRYPAYGQTYTVYGWKPLPDVLDEDTENILRFYD